MSEYILEMKDIEKSFPGVKALDYAQLKVRPGTVHALMGENGAGKSTLMKVLFGIYAEDGGVIEYNGEIVFYEDIPYSKFDDYLVNQEHKKFVVS